MSDYTVSRFVFHYTLTLNEDDTEEYYVTTHGFRTRSTDTPANYYVEERVKSAGSIKRSLFSGARVAGANSPSYGTTELNNEDGGLDEFVKYAAGGYVTCYYGDDTMEFPGEYTVVYTTKVFSVIADFETVLVRYQDRTSDLDKAVVTALFKGTGGLEGYEGITARKPLCLGFPGLMPLTLINKEFQVYSVQSNAVDSVFVAGSDPFATLFEGGVPVDRDSSYMLATELLTESTAPDPGHYKMWYGYGGLNPGGGFYSAAAAAEWNHGPVYLRLGTPPTAELRMGLRGFLRNRYDAAPRTWKFTDLCNRAGMEDVTPTNLGTVNGVVEDFTAGNHYIDDDRTYLDLMNDRAQSLLGFFGFDRFGRFYCGRLLGPETGGDSSLYTFTFENSSGFLKSAIDGMESPVWQFTVNSGATRPAAPLPAASAEMTDLLSREPWSVTFTGTSTDVLKNFPGAKSVSIDIQGNDFTEEDSRVEFLERFSALYGQQRDFVYLTAKEFSPTTLALGLHDKVTLQVPRFDYSAGVDFRIIDIEIDLDSKEIKFGLWGNVSDEEDWDLGGGGYPAGAGEPGGSDGGDGSTPPPGSVPPGGGGTEPPPTSSNPEHTQAKLADLIQEMFCVPSPTPMVQEYTMEDLAAITRVVADGEPGFVRQALLLHADGSLTDSSGTGKVVTAVNGAGTSSGQSVFGGSALFFDGTNDYFTVPDHDDFDFARRVWSIDLRLYLAATPNADQPLVCKWVNSGSWSWYLGTNSSRQIRFFSSYDGTNGNFGGTSQQVALNTWAHIACWRYGNTVYIAIDGTIYFTVGVSSSLDFFTTTAALGIGALGSGTSPAKSMYIDELRICVDRIPYSTAGFTVPTQAYVE